MLKSVLFTVLLSLPLLVFCQEANTDSGNLSCNKRLDNIELRNQYAGKELQAFRKGYFTGAALQATGVSLLAISVAISQKREFNTGITIGGGIAICGTLVMIGSHTYIHRAGLYLSEKGLTVPIRGKKH